MNEDSAAELVVTRDSTLQWTVRYVDIYHWRVSKPDEELKHEQ